MTSTQPSNPRPIIQPIIEPMLSMFIMTRPQCAEADGLPAFDVAILATSGSFRHAAAQLSQATAQSLQASMQDLKFSWAITGLLKKGPTCPLARRSTADGRPAAVNSKLMETWKTGAHGFLELRIPPPAVAAIAAALMWGIAAALPSLRVDVPHAGLIAGICAALGVLIGGAGLITLRRARTTHNPLHPEAATSLVTTGVYRWTRNPMYLGSLPLLAGWAVYLQHAGALLAVPLFMLYLIRFQIIPEERALAAKFGGQFDAYRQRVRRWL